MVNRTNRRHFIQTVGLTSLGLFSGCTGQSTRSRDVSTNSPTSKPTAFSTNTATPATDDGTVQRDHEADSQEFSDEILTKAKHLGKTVQQSVVGLSNRNSGGTGWIIEEGYVMTNSHVVREFETMDVETFDKRTGTVTRVGYHQNMIPDIALLKTDIETPEPLTMKTDVSISKGDPVLAVGHPGRIGDWVISLGTYYSYESGMDWILADIPTDRGNSGSPLLTLDGTVIGCISGTTSRGDGERRVNRPEKVYTKFPQPDNLATTTPSKTIKKWVDQWK